MKTPPKDYIHWQKCPKCGEPLCAELWALFVKYPSRKVVTGYECPKGHKFRVCVTSKIVYDGTTWRRTSP